jgi:CheY-like chemotaxis protein
MNPSPNQGVSIDGARTRILLLEDDEAFTALLHDALDPALYEITSVTNGVEGLKKVMSADFDIILCDMMMPSLPGDMFYLAVERTRPHLSKRFIFMTGHRSDPKWDAFIRKVGGSMLWKPFPLQDLMDAIQAVIRKTQFQKPMI